MALNWKFTDKTRFKRLTDSELSHNDTFIWGCLRVGIRNITEKNAEEWQWRYVFADKLNGELQIGFTPTIEDVQKRIGLTTNCTALTRKEFVSRQNAIATEK